MTVRYHFPRWVREQIGSERPADVKRWFDSRNVERSTEFWRGLLRRRPKASLVLETWAEIVDATGLPLSTFVEIEPSRTPPAARARPVRGRKSKPAPPPRPRPPRPADYFGAARG